MSLSDVFWIFNGHEHVFIHCIENKAVEWQVQGNFLK